MDSVLLTCIDQRPSAQGTQDPQERYGHFDQSLFRCSVRLNQTNLVESRWPTNIVSSDGPNAKGLSRKQ